MDVIELPDFFNMDLPVLSPRVYYDDTGTIRGVSFVDDESLSLFKTLGIDETFATKLMNGEQTISDWIVDTTTLSLVKINEVIDFEIVSQDEMDLLIPDTKTEQVTLRISIPKKGNYIGLRFHTFSPYWKINAKGDTKLHFVLTKKNYPHIIIAAFKVSIQELSSCEMLTFKVSTTDFDIYTSRCYPLKYEVEKVKTVQRILKTPTAFEDVRLVKKSKPVSSCLVFERCNGFIKMRLLNGGGPIYDRSMETLSVVFCAPGDPHHPYYMTKVVVKELDGCKIEIPKELLTREFDICTQMLYYSMYDCFVSND